MEISVTKSYGCHSWCVTSYVGCSRARQPQYCPRSFLLFHIAEAFCIVDRHIVCFSIFVNAIAQCCSKAEC